MKKCLLDGSRLADAAAIYRALTEAFRFPDNFGRNPKALATALGEYSGEPVTIVWRHAVHSADRLGGDFTAIVAALQNAAADGVLSLELA